jgi:glycosyltransferase family protein
MKKKICALTILAFLIAKEFKYYKYYKFCLKCINYDNNNFTKCLECPYQLIFKGIKILSNDKTLDEIIYKNKSISRFGDGEYKIILGGRNGFQKANKTLANKLFHVLNIKDKNFLVGINLPYQDKTLKKLKRHSQKYWIKYFRKYKFKIVRIIKNKKYYSGAISRFYLAYKDKTNVPKYIKKLKKIWERKDILIIEGEKSRLGIGNDLFNNTKSIKRIICPVKNAFKVYDKIINAVLELHDKRLILLALGPTATILAYDLYKLGYQSVDIGHVDIEYEWFLRNATHKIQIENKYTNEACRNRHNFSVVKDKKYYKQIIKKILN